MIPCTEQENISSRLALLLESIWKRSAMSLAIGPDIIRAMVLLAVQRLAMLTRAAILNSAPRLPRIRLVRPEMMKSRPPLYLMISSMPPASIVTMTSSPIEPIPSPTDPSHPTHENEPQANPMTAFASIPKTSTAATSIPASARPMTRR